MELTSTNIMSGIIGKKVGMTRIFEDDGKVTPITIVECTPNRVIQIKTMDNDGYSALVLGFSELKKPKKTKKYAKVREFRIDESKLSEYKKGEDLTVGNFEKDDSVTVVATSKGKGFQGVIKRHNFSRGPETHGSHHHREPGSIGACTKPGRVAKGKKLPGRMGGKQVTLNKVKILSVDTDKNIICLKGAIPGPNGGLVTIKK